jgi:long-subunit fatty acid transport protein
MKNKYYVVAILLCFLMSPVFLFAFGVYNYHNQSAEYLKTQTRNASTDSDAAYFNPAGTALMKEGFYFYISDQYLRAVDTLRTPSLTRNSYKGIEEAMYWPNIYFVYNTKLGPGKLAWSLGILPIGGGGAVFNKGLQALDVGLYFLAPLINQFYTLLGSFVGITPPPGVLINYPDVVLTSKLTQQVMIAGPTTSLAYSFMDEKLSFSLGYRLIYGMGTIDTTIKQNGIRLPIGGDYHGHMSGFAHGIIVGISSKPIDAITVGVRVEYSTPLRMKMKAHDDWIMGMQSSSLKDGGYYHAQLPPILAAGVAYRISGWQIALGTHIYFNRAAQWKGQERSYTTGFDLSAGVDYTLTAIPLNIGVGYQYTYIGARPSARSQLNSVLDFHGISCGLTYAFTDRLKGTLSYMHIHYVPTNVNKGNSMGNLPVKAFGGDFYKEADAVAVGFEYKAI